MFSSSSQSRRLHKSGTEDRYFASSRRRGRRRRNNYCTNRRTRGNCETAEWKSCYFSVETNVCLVCCLPLSFFLCFSVFLHLVSKISPSRYERRGDFFIKDRSDWDAQTRWMKLDIVISICVNEEYTLYHVAYCPPRDKYCCFLILIALL